MKNKLLSAIILNFSLSWGLAALFKLLGLSYSGTTMFIEGILYMFMPALSIVILSKFFWKLPLKTWGIRRPHGRNLFLACLFPFLLALLATGISLLFPGVKFQPGMEGIIAKYSTTLPSEAINAMKSQISSLGLLLPLIIFAQALIGGLTINTIAAFGEEFFWRGFLLKQLKKYGWLKASLIIGSLWGFWHAPLILQGHNYPQHPIIGVFMMILWCDLLSIAMTYFTVKTKSVFTAAFFHGLLNGSAGLAIIWISGGNDLSVGVTGLAGFLALIILNFVLYLSDKKSSLKISDALHDY
jgi:membrane protease YdiL (CAAX protease family)